MFRINLGKVGLYTDGWRGNSFTVTVINRSEIALCFQLDQLPSELHIIDSESQVACQTDAGQEGQIAEEAEGALRLSSDQEKNKEACGATSPQQVQQVKKPKCRWWVGALGVYHLQLELRNELVEELLLDKAEISEVPLARAVSGGKAEEVGFWVVNCANPTNRARVVAQYQFVSSQHLQTLSLQRERERRRVSASSAAAAAALIATSAKMVAIASLQVAVTAVPSVNKSKKEKVDIKVSQASILDYISPRLPSTSTPLSSVEGQVAPMTRGGLTRNANTLSPIGKQNQSVARLARTANQEAGPEPSAITSSEESDTMHTPQTGKSESGTGASENAAESKNPKRHHSAEENGAGQEKTVNTKARGSGSGIGNGSSNSSLQAKKSSRRVVAKKPQSHSHSQSQLRSQSHVGLRGCTPISGAFEWNCMLTHHQHSHAHAHFHPHIHTHAHTYKQRTNNAQYPQTRLYA